MIRFTILLATIFTLACGPNYCPETTDYGLCMADMHHQLADDAETSCERISHGLTSFCYQIKSGQLDVKSCQDLLQEELSRCMEN